MYRSLSEYYSSGSSIREISGTPAYFHSGGVVEMRGTAWSSRNDLRTPLELESDTDCGDQGTGYSRRPYDVRYNPLRRTRFIPSQGCRRGNSKAGGEKTEGY